MMDTGGGSRYELLELIGAGGMAEVFRARMVGAVGFEKQVAIKRILPDFSSDEEFIQRFIDEARLTARLVHPNICQILDFGSMEERYFIAMEFVDGLDLAGVLAGVDRDDERIPIDVTLFILCGLLRGLKYAHEATDEGGSPLGIVHRDVSPSNVLLSVNGDVKVGDLGAATANPEVRSARTERHFRLGKVLYMAPEQRRMQAVDARADIYSVGILLAEMLLGETIFHRNANMFLAGLTTLWGQVEEELSSPLGNELAGVIKRSLQEDPTQRYQSADEMLGEIDRIMREHVPGTSVDRLSRLVARIKRRFKEATENSKVFAKPQVSSAISLNTADLQSVSGSFESPALAGDPRPDFDLNGSLPDFEPSSAGEAGLDNEPTNARGALYPEPSPPPSGDMEEPAASEGLDEYVPTFPSGQPYIAEDSLDLLDQPLEDDYRDDSSYPSHQPPVPVDDYRDDSSYPSHQTPVPAEPYRDSSPPSHQTPVPSGESGWGAGRGSDFGGTMVEPPASSADDTKSRWPRWLPGLVIVITLVVVLVFGLIFGGVLADRFLADPITEANGPDPASLVGTTPGTKRPNTAVPSQPSEPPQTPPATGSDAGAETHDGYPESQGEGASSPAQDAAPDAGATDTRPPPERPDRRPVKGQRPPVRRPGPTKTGYLNINSIPVGVPFVDGRRIAAETPVANYELPVGRHTVKVYFPQERRWDTDRVTIQENQTVGKVLRLD